MIEFANLDLRKMKLSDMDRKVIFKIYFQSFLAKKDTQSEAHNQKPWNPALGLVLRLHKMLTKEQAVVVVLCSNTVISISTVSCSVLLLTC